MRTLVSITRPLDLMEHRCARSGWIRREKARPGYDDHGIAAASAVSISGAHSAAGEVCVRNNSREPSGFGL